MPDLESRHPLAPAGRAEATFGEVGTPSMKPGLSAQLDHARAELARLERAARQATCQQLGTHDWRLVGGKNAGCGHVGCGCSVPVYECTRCGDCDYGDNAEAAKALAACEARHADEVESDQQPNLALEDLGSAA